MNVAITNTEIQILVDGVVVGVAAEETEVQIIEVGIQGPPGPTGTSGTTTVDEALIYLVWGTPSVESANAIEIPASLTSLLGSTLTSSLADIQVMITDGATDNEPSATAILSAANTPVGTILAGSGTATLTIRTQAGQLKVKVTETSIGNRYLWIKQGGNARLWVRSSVGVLELIFN